MPTTTLLLINSPLSGMPCHTRKLAIASYWQIIDNPPMPLPPEIRDRLKKSSDVKVNLRPQQSELAVIEGKTTVPFNAFVKLILQKKIQGLVKDAQDEPVILSSDLLTKIASAPGESLEDRSKVLLTACVIGFCGGFFVAAFAIVFLGMMGVEIGQKELIVALTVLLVVALAVYGALQIHTRKIKELFIEKIERIAEMFSR